MSRRIVALLDEISKLVQELFLALNTRQSRFAVELLRVEFEKAIFLAGYKRDLMQSQDVYIEVAFEKLTIQSILKPIADKYTLPMAPARGMSSGTANQEIFDRFSASGKDRPVLLVITDLDPGDRGVEDRLDDGAGAIGRLTGVV